MYLLKANDNFVAPAMDRFRTFEEPAIALMLALVRPGEDVVDAGANIGTHLLPLAVKAAGRCAGGGRGDDAPRGAVFAFEPQPLLHAVLHAQLALLGDGCVAAAVTALKAAAGDGDLAVATVPILSDETQNHAQMSLVDGSAYGRPDSARYRNVSAPVRSIDGVLEEYGRVLGASPTARGRRPVRCPALIKVDVEGMEDAALNGAKKTLRRCPPPALYVENNNHPDAGLARRHCPPELGYVAFHHAFGYADRFGDARAFDDALFKESLKDLTSRNLLCIARWQADRFYDVPGHVSLDLVAGYESIAADMFEPEFLELLARSEP